MARNPQPLHPLSTDPTPLFPVRSQTLRCAPKWGNRLIPTMNVLWPTHRTCVSLSAGRLTYRVGSSRLRGLRGACPQCEMGSCVFRCSGRGGSAVCCELSLLFCGIVCALCLGVDNVYPLSTRVRVRLTLTHQQYVCPKGFLTSILLRVKKPNCPTLTLKGRTKTTVRKGMDEATTGFNSLG